MSIDLRSPVSNRVSSVGHGIVSPSPIQFSTFAPSRGWLMGLPSYVDCKLPEIPKLIAVGGGKGGVGKSILSANLASRLAQMGLRVLVIDLDLGCANLHTHFGIPKPKYTLANYILFGDRSFPEIITSTTISGVALVAGGQEAAWGRQLARGPEALLPLWDAILRSRSQFQVDVVLMDLGAGTQRHTMEFFAAAHLGITAVLPEPTSIENAYVFLKTHLWHLLDHVALRTGEMDGAQDLRAALTRCTQDGSGKGYGEAFRQIAAAYPNYIRDVFTAMRSRPIGVVINQTRSQADVDIGASMELICRRYFSLPAYYLGDMNYDDCAWKSLRNRRLLLNDFPHANISKRVARIANNALALIGKGGE